ncbi:MAG: CNP1-like family protein [Burkholderiales bacterium]
MEKIRAWTAGFALAAWLTAGPAHGQTPWADWDYKFDQEITPWSEMQTQIPAYPAEENLIPLVVDGTTQHRYYVDAKSVSVGNDGVMRYILVIRTSGGSTNVSFEGIRCESREQKYYAIGRSSDRTWVRARNPQWRRVDFREFAAYNFTLYAEYACRGKQVAGTAEQIVAALRRGPPRPSTVD